MTTLEKLENEVWGLTGQTVTTAQALQEAVQDLKSERRRQLAEKDAALEREHQLVQDLENKLWAETNLAQDFAKQADALREELAKERKPAHDLDEKAHRLAAGIRMGALEAKIVELVQEGDVLKGKLQKANEEKAIFVRQRDENRRERDAITGRCEELRAELEQEKQLTQDLEKKNNELRSELDARKREVAQLLTNGMNLAAKCATLETMDSQKVRDLQDWANTRIAELERALNGLNSRPAEEVQRHIENNRLLADQNTSLRAELKHMRQQLEAQRGTRIIGDIPGAKREERERLKPVLRVNSWIGHISKMRELAQLQGFTEFEWNGRIYLTETGEDTGWLIDGSPSRCFGCQNAETELEKHHLRCRKERQ